MQAVTASAAALDVKDAPVQLRTYVLNRLVQAREAADESFTCRKAVEQAHNDGDCFLSDQAGEWLDAKVGRRAGSSESGHGAMMRMEAPVWAAHASFGRLSHQLVGTRVLRVYNLPFTSFDYQHMLLPAEFVRAHLNLAPGQLEYH